MAGRHYFEITMFPRLRTALHAALLIDLVLFLFNVLICLSFVQM